MELKVSKVYKEFLQTQKRYAVLYGGAGSGKSVVAAQKILMRLLGEHPHNFLVVRKVARTLRESVFALFKKLINDLNLDSEFKINNTNMTIEAFNGNRIIFFGLDNAEKIKSITDITSIWVEEATELKEDDFDQLDLRLRGETKNYKQIIITFNPVSSKHWVKKKFFDFATDDVFALKTTYLDNPFVGDEYRLVMQRLKDDNPEYYKIYALGEWGEAKGLIYKEYETINSMPEFFETEFVGLDFGYNHAYAVVHVRIKEKNLYVDELVYEKGRTNEEIIEYLENYYPFVKDLTIYADSARPDLISDYEKAGFMVEKANKAVFDGINTVKSFKLFITQRSVNILKEIELYRWREDKDGNSIDEPVKLNDDAMDAIRYAMTPYIQKSGGVKSLSLDFL